MIPRCIDKDNEAVNVGRVPLNAPKIAGCLGNSPYIYVEGADNLDESGLTKIAL